MRRIPAVWLAVCSIVACGVVACGAGPPPGAEAARAPTVVLVSMDGTRPADCTPDRLPTLVALAARGARAERLAPSLPTNTFPNHVTLATGVRPQRHGIVDNRFVDPERGLFDRSDIPAWIEVEPIWSLLEGQGVPTASFYWVGSEGAVPGGHAPRYWKRFDKSTPEVEKVDQILAWLALPEPERPRLVTTWFRGADHASHHHGPDSPEAVKTLRAQDAELARLVAALEERKLWPTTTLLVVSDHGMMVPARRIDLDAALAQAGVDGRVVGIGGFASVHVAPGDWARAVEVARSLGLEAWRREDAPDSVPVDSPRFGPVVVLAPRGAALVYDGLALTGFHGHRPSHPEMGAIFFAAGRGVAAGTVLPEVSGLDVAPTVLSLLGAPVPSWMEGRSIADALRGAGGDG